MKHPHLAPTNELLKLVCHKAISPSVPYKVSPSHKKEAESIWMISKGKNFFTLEFGMFPLYVIYWVVFNFK